MFFCILRYTYRPTFRCHVFGYLNYLCFNFQVLHRALEVPKLNNAKTPLFYKERILSASRLYERVVTAITCHTSKGNFPVKSIKYTANNSSSIKGLYTEFAFLPLLQMADLPHFAQEVDCGVRHLAPSALPDHCYLVTF